MKNNFYSDGNSLRKSLPSLASAIVLAACATLAFGCAQFHPGAPVAPGTPVAAVSFCQSTANGCTPGGSFEVGGTRTLDVVIEWQNLPAGAHSQKVSFILPSGDEYQTFERSFEVPDGSSGAVTMTQSLPVAGTWIDQRRLSGMWQVNFSLDGTPMGTQAVQLTQ